VSDRWLVYASKGRGQEKDRRVVRAETAMQAAEVATQARGWAPVTRLRVKRLGPIIKRKAVKHHE
jgi:hypothetical protein